MSSEELKRYMEIAFVTIKERVLAARGNAERPRRAGRVPPIKVKKTLIVLSIDVCALYLSITKKIAVKSLRNCKRKSKLSFWNIDLKRLTRYILMTVDKKTMKSEGFEDQIPIFNSKITFKSVTNLSKNSRKLDGGNQFILAENQPSNGYIKKLLALAILLAVDTAMKDPYYRIGRIIIRQNEEGAIGSDMTGETSEIVMSDWDTRFLKKLTKLGIKLDLYKRYFKDIVIVISLINKRWRFNGSIME